MNDQISFNTQGKHSLIINGKDVLLSTAFTVISLFICENKIVIITDDSDLHGVSVTNSYKPNREGNIFALNFQGELLWTYNDIAQTPLHFPFSGGYIANDDNKTFFSKWFHIEFHPKHTYLIATDNADGNAIIDLTVNRWIDHISFRS